ncbi:MAG: peptide chain release factor N(5)-glutamine methyltransferase [Lachnospiraceae bacterium]|nr:peptide chain release factor N(5)-glutamine methyltransferase [Lachnospiraceae bacterium]
MQLKELIKYGEDSLRDAGIESFTNDAKLLAMFIFGLDYTGIFMKLYDEVPLEDEEAYKDVIDIRSTHYPCQYIIGSQDFMGYTFKCSEGVLIPRPETEILVETALQLTEGYKDIKALDMCCGTGCIGISYNLKRLESGHTNDFVQLADISREAIELCEENVFNLGAKCDIVRTDLFEKIEHSYDIIMSNPPYIPTSDIDDIMEDVREFEPRLALDGMEDGLYFYDNIIRRTDRYLRQDGILIFEIGYNQYQDIRELLINKGFTDVSVKKDYAGLDRVVIARR